MEVVNNILEIDLSKKLEITINNQKPVGLADLTMSLLAFNEQFHKFVESETTDDYQIGSELFIKEVRNGSIVVELVSQAAAIVPLIWEGGSLSQWLKQVEQIALWLLGKQPKPPRDMDRRDFKQWHSILEPIAKDHASQLNLNVSDGGVVLQQFVINSEHANAMQNEISRYIDKLDLPEDHVQKKRVMSWKQSKFDIESHTGDKAVIESISKKPIKVVFQNNAVKEEMLAGDKRFTKQWQYLAYLVDVEVQTIEGEPKIYTILKYYPEHTFDPAE